MDYPNIPTEEDLRVEVRDMLDSCHSQTQILQKIQNIACPYHREAIATYLSPCWHEMELQGDERTYYLDMDGYEHHTWMDIDSDMRRIIRLTHREQVAIELSDTANNQNNQSPIAPPQACQKQINQYAQTIHHYDHCTIYQCAEIPPSALPTAKATTPTYPAFYRTNSQAITAIEEKWNEALAKQTKTGMIRFLYQHDHSNGYFRLSHLPHAEQAQLLNAAQNKYRFTDHDFENANKPLKKN